MIKKLLIAALMLTCCAINAKIINVVNNTNYWFNLQTYSKLESPSGYQCLMASSVDYKTPLESLTTIDFKESFNTAFYCGNVSVIQHTLRLVTAVDNIATTGLINIYFSKDGGDGYTKDEESYPFTYIKIVPPGSDYLPDAVVTTDNHKNIYIKPKA